MKRLNYTIKFPFCQESENPPIFRGKNGGGGEKKRRKKRAGGKNRQNCRYFQLIATGGKNAANTAKMRGRRKCGKKCGIVEKMFGGKLN
ncbi:MAG: hypothetical protein HAW59_05695 [Betaproteobacteria bacterium]|nr:hypothetical protein [Betaproteobacteria bacterium]